MHLSKMVFEPYERVNGKGVQKCTLALFIVGALNWS